VLAHHVRVAAERYRASMKKFFQNRAAKKIDETIEKFGDLATPFNVKLAMAKK